jgi:hypothetical protein
VTLNLNWNQILSLSFLKGGCEKPCGIAKRYMLCSYEEQAIGMVSAAARKFPPMAAADLSSMPPAPGSAGLLGVVFKYAVTGVNPGAKTVSAPVG